MATRIVSDTSLTAVADAIREKGGTSSPLTFPDGFVDAIGDIETGGGGGVVVKPSDVNFIDYDGTILYSYSAAEAQALTELPANPSHEGLISQGWNWSLADMKAQVTAIGGCDIGQMYITDDNKTRLYCHFGEGTKNPNLRVYINGTIIIDWGDGSPTDTLTGTSTSTAVYIQHIYVSAGDYIISIDATNATVSFSTSTTGLPGLILGTAQATVANVDFPYASTLRKVELGTNVTIDTGAFGFTSIESITIPSNITNINQYAFDGCYNLKSITIPAGITQLTNYLFQTCSSLKYVSIPKSTTKIGNNVFCVCYSINRIIFPSTLTSIGSNMCYGCYNLKSIIIPDGVTSLSNYAFRQCYGLEDIKLSNELTSFNSYCLNNCRVLKKLIAPNGIVTIAANAFAGCSGITEYHFKATTPPSLANTNAFSSMSVSCRIYVPYSADHSVLDAYKTATNWSNFASKIIEEAAS